MRRARKAHSIRPPCTVEKSDILRAAPSPDAPRPPGPRRGGPLVLASALAVIAAATLWPDPGNADLAAATPITCLVCGDLGLIDVLLNVCLFVPLGIGVRLTARGSTARGLLTAAVSGLLVSLTVEATQGLALPGRDASLSDLLTNTTGATVGYLLVGMAPHIVAPTRQVARTLTIICAGAWLSVITLTAWLLQPDLPQTDYYGQWAADLAQFDRFRGTVQDATVGGTPLPQYRLPDSPRIRAALLAGGEVTAAATTGPAPERTAPVLSVFDGEHAEILVLGQRGRAAIFRLRLRTASARLRTPAVRVDDAIPPAAGVAVALRGSLRHQRYTVAVAGAGSERSRSLALSPFWGWAMLMPVRDYAIGPEAAAGTALWIGFLLVPLGYFAAGLARMGGRALALGAACAAAIGAMIVIPAAFGMATAEWTAWAGLAAGLGTGAGLDRLAARRRGERPA